MGIDREDSKRAGKAIATMAALMLLAGCMTHQPRGIDAYQTSGIDQWLATADADKVVNAMSAKGLMPATIDCRFADTTPGQVAYLSKFTWRRAPANTRYHWEIGDPTYLASDEVKANRVGLRRVFAKATRDAATGQKVGCSIWAG
ncbi:hypothetical protein [Mesorhizobium humile]|jgi:hypothetical protein|uniref:Uncharacterized protein n=1 Tax=Mesorhizobium humile TaxID=3072313 RepID=A0ABU4YE83_9HYPH|nr:MULTISPECIES: hypothetical protein [unclassified Mesorhizobium]MDX8460647.1 hypothetical protein [Mesorhizobium sp. VK2D]MDX8485264.1 hypothetical protein [Mesorhizobium sp. VK2B]